MRRIRAVAAAIVAVAAMVPAKASATDGPLYGFGASVWAVAPPFTATVLGGPVWQIQVPAVASIAVKNHYEMNWGCPAPGSEVAAVQWSALRTQAASSLALRVTGNGQVIWAEGDAAIPQSPQPGRAYDVRLPSGHCNVHLALYQAENRAQHARGYFIDNPRILVRDVSPPGMALQGITAGWLPAAAAARVAWSVADNFGADGVGGQRILIDGDARWVGAPGVGVHAVDVPLAGLGDGVHPVEIQVDGDGTGGAAAGGAVAVDSTPPTAKGLAFAPAVGPGGTLSWEMGDNLSGPATSTAELNAASDGTASGAWEALGVAAGAGKQSVAIGELPVADGVHAWRVRASDGAGNAASVTAPGRIAVDTTPPSLDVESVPSGWVNRASIELTATDNLQAELGLGPIEVDVNTAADGGDSGQWLRRATSTAPAGRRAVPVDLGGLENGHHALRIVARNGGRFGGVLVAERRASVRVDLTDPVLAQAGFSSGGARPMTVSWVAEDAHSGVATATVQWRDGSTWRTLANQRAGDGADSMVVDASGLPDGVRTLRLIVGDGAGNTAVRIGTARITGGGVAATAGDRLGRLRDARLTVTLVGARRERRAAGTAFVRRIVAGGRVSLAGRLVDRKGHGIVRAEVEVRDHRGRLVGRGLTRHDGRFSIEASPVGGGLLRVGVAIGGRLVPRHTGGVLRVEVRPRVRLAASRVVVAPGHEVVFSGRLRPSPVELGVVSRKGIVLEWRDPLRRTWRPVVNTRLRSDGTFAIPWAFGLGGLTIPMRVVVPAEVGWPLLPARSGVVRVRVT